MAAPTVTATLTWTRDLQFDARSGRTSMTIDGRAAAGPSPVDALAMALAGCMAIDVVDIVTKGRHDVTGCDVTLTAERAPDPPRRFVKVDLHFVLTGNMPETAVRRAIALSREKYCSVWQTLRQDIPFNTTCEVRL